MEKIQGEIRTWLDSKTKIAMGTVEDVRKSSGYKVKNFSSLTTKVASLAFFNPSLELLYRGQSKDHKNSSALTSLLPSIMRSPNGYFTKALAKNRFEKLVKAEKGLCDHATFKGLTRICRYRVLQWAIIQHYEICPTPFLDVTLPC